MFTAPRRRNSSQWKLQKRKNRRRPKVRMIALASLGIFLGLELFLRAIASFTQWGEQLTENPATERIQAYQLKFVNAQKQPYAALPSQGQLLAARDPLLGYHLIPQQKNPYWTINAQGFRDPEDLPQQKPKNEVRIFVLGGSTAFGQFVSDRALFSHQLEQLLNNQVALQRSKPNQFQPEILPFTLDEVNKVLQRPVRIPDRVYRVINAAVPGYASGNEFALLTQQIADYSPDVIISLNSYTDLLLPSSENAADVPGIDHILSGKPMTGQQTRASIGDWFGHLYGVKFAQSFMQKRQQQQQERQVIGLNLIVPDPTQPLDQQLTDDGAELQRRLDRYQEQLAQIVRWSAVTKNRLIIGLPPEITGRQEKGLTPEELAIVKALGEHYSQRLRAGHTKLKATATATLKATKHGQLIDFYSLYDKFPGRAFESPVSLTEPANQLLAQRLYESIAKQLAIEPKPYEAGLRK